MKLKFLLSFLGTSFAMAGLVLGLYQVSQSPLFFVRSVEVSEANQNKGDENRVDEILRLAEIPVGQVSLFNLDLAVLEAKILRERWIRSVSIQKKFPGTIYLEVVYRQPVALVQGPRGQPVAVDSEGFRIASLELSQNLDLPIIHERDLLTNDQLKAALNILDEWEQHDISKTAWLSSIAWDFDRGFKFGVVYRMTRMEQSNGDQLSQKEKKVSRSTVFMGHLDQATTEKRQKIFDNLLSVFKYLDNNSVFSRQIFAEAGKKIVVKIRRDS